MEKDVDHRPEYSYYVMRGQEESALLIGARTDNTTAVECLYHEVNRDHPYTTGSGKRKKNNTAKTRIMVCDITFKQNIGHLGTKFAVAAVHGNFNTMKMRWPDVLKKFWDRLASVLKKI